MKNYIENLLRQRKAAFEECFTDPKAIKFIEDFSKLIANTYKRHSILICGNGGSASQASHFAAELVGHYKSKRNLYRPIVLTADSAIMTALSNDYNYDAVFSMQVESLGSEKDVLVAISTSGNSNNIVYALKQAHDRGMTTVALLGRGGGVAKEYADLCYIDISQDTAIIQEHHLSILHMVCDILEQQ